MLTRLVRLLKDLLTNNLMFTREELTCFIEGEFDVDISQCTISRTLQKERISRKKVSLRRIANLISDC